MLLLTEPDGRQSESANCPHEYSEHTESAWDSYLCHWVSFACLALGQFCLYSDMSRSQRTGYCRVQISASPHFLRDQVLFDMFILHCYSRVHLLDIHSLLFFTFLASESGEELQCFVFVFYFSLIYTLSTNFWVWMKGKKIMGHLLFSKLKVFRGEFRAAGGLWKGSYNRDPSRHIKHERSCRGHQKAKR